MDVKWVKIATLSAFQVVKYQVVKYMRTVKQ